MPSLKISCLAVLDELFSVQVSCDELTSPPHTMRLQQTNKDNGGSSPATTQKQRRQGRAIYYTLNVYNITN